MIKFLTLCWECQKLIGQHYDVMPTEKRDDLKKKCEQCGKTYGLKYCFVRTKEKDV